MKAVLKRFRILLTTLGDLMVSQNEVSELLTDVEQKVQTLGKQNVAARARIKTLTAQLAAAIENQSDVNTQDVLAELQKIDGELSTEIAAGNADDSTATGDSGGTTPAPTPAPASATPPAPQPEPDPQTATTAPPESAPAPTPEPGSE